MASTETADRHLLDLLHCMECFLSSRLGRPYTCPPITGGDVLGQLDDTVDLVGHALCGQVRILNAIDTASRNPPKPISEAAEVNSQPSTGM